MLARPSRRVPTNVRLGLFAGEPSAFFGWFLIGLGMCFVWNYGGDNLLRDWALFREELGVVHGTIISVVPHRKGFTEHHYSYNIKGVAYTGMTRGMYRHHAAGDKVEIEYALADVVRSRMRGLSTTRRGLLAVAFIPAVGMILVLRGMLKALKGGYLLSHGTLTTGTLVSRAPTLEMERSKRVYRFVFTFGTDGGRTYEVSARTTRSQSPDGVIVYDVRRPRRAVLLGTLFGRPTIDERDEVTTEAPFWLLLLPSVLPTVVIVGHTYWALHVCEIL